MDHCILIASFLSLSTLISFAKGAIGLGVVIFVHELGHFLVAKACGVKCEKFYVGFDPPLQLFGFQLPRTLFKHTVGETEYGIGIIPLGGYVKMLGQDDNPANAAAEAERIKAEGGKLDPRSYPAKSVPQRMAIISAGVIFNLIFGVIFASVAYRMGVRFTPTVIGGSGVGDPAWLAGIQPGDRIVALEASKPTNDHLRFVNDLRLHLLSLNNNDSVDMRLRDLEGHVRELNITPSLGYKKITNHPTIGVWMANTPTVRGVVTGSIANQAGLEPGDKIHAVTVDGVRTEIDVDGPALDLQKIMLREQQSPLTLHVTRVDQKTEATSSHDIELGVAYDRRFGIEFEMGPVVCIQKNSVADKAGMQVGDVLSQINGSPVGDPLTLSTRILDFVGQTTTIAVLRNGEKRQLTMTPQAPRMDASARRRNGPIGLDPLGIGYVMRPTVASVVPDSPAAKAGIQSGDVVKSAQLFMPFQPVPKKDRWPWIFGNWQDHRKKKQTERLLDATELDKPLLIDDENNNWPFIVGSVQGAETYEVAVKFQREGEEQVVTMSPEVSDTYLEPMRGFILAGYEETRRAESWSEAFGLGVREVWEGMKQVLVVLRKIGSNYQNLGGPLTIAAVATMEADEGLPRLLVFLTLLSANLAVLNFLPIPVLDGGHMVFLAWEGIVGKPVNERVQMSLTLLGFSFLLCLMIFVFGLDLTRFLG